MPAAPVLAGVVPPTARVAHLGAVIATVGLAGLPALVTVARGGTDLGVGIVLLALGTGAALAWAVDDPTEDLLAPTPVSAPVRAATRVLAAAVVAGLVCAAILAIVAAGPGLPPDLGDRLAEAAAAGAVALAAAFVAAGQGERLVGAGGVVAGLLVPAVVAGLAMRWPDWFPTFDGGRLHDRWWLLVAAGLVVVARVGRDPSSP
jgi:hypothetical protein